MALRREIKVVADALASSLADALADPANASRTAEELAEEWAEEVAEEAIKALDAHRAKTHRLAVVANYRWRADEEPRLAVFGPFSTRATSAASAVGSAMAGTPQGGSGKWMLVPAYANARAAWDAIKPPSKEEQRMRKFLESIRGSHPNNPSIWHPLTPPGSAATCCCGIRSGNWCRVHEKGTP